jgi:hypothetical protein
MLAVCYRDSLEQSDKTKIQRENEQMTNLRSNKQSKKHDKLFLLAQYPATSFTRLRTILGQKWLHLLCNVSFPTTLSACLSKLDYGTWTAWHRRLDYLEYLAPEGQQRVTGL